jgi:hypothetical protein
MTGLGEILEIWPLLKQKWWVVCIGV